jgi:hypothetical protein
LQGTICNMTHDTATYGMESKEVVNWDLDYLYNKLQMQILLRMY